MHDDGSGCQVCPEAHAVGISDPHAAGNHVVHHARKAVDSVHRQMLALAPQVHARLDHAVDWHGAHTRPGDERQNSEDAVEIDAARAHESVREQVEPEVGVRNISGCSLQISDDGRHRPHARAAHCVRVDAGFQMRHINCGGPEHGLGVPDLKEGVTVVGGQAQSGGGAAHGRCFECIGRHAATVAT